MEYKERNPSIEDMIETVAEQKKRPSFRPELRKNFCKGQNQIEFFTHIEAYS